MILYRGTTFPESPGVGSCVPSHSVPSDTLVFRHTRIAAPSMAVNITVTVESASAGGEKLLCLEQNLCSLVRSESLVASFLLARRHPAPAEVSILSGEA